MKQLLFLLGVCFILTSCVEDTLYELTIDFTDGTRSTWECRSLGGVANATNSHSNAKRTSIRFYDVYGNEMSIAKNYIISISSKRIEK